MRSTLGLLLTWCKLAKVNLNPEFNGNFNQTTAWLYSKSRCFTLHALIAAVWSGNPNNCKCWASLHRLHDSEFKVSVTENFIFQHKDLIFLNRNIQATKKERTHFSFPPENECSIDSAAEQYWREIMLEISLVYRISHRSNTETLPTVCSLIQVIGYTSVFKTLKKPKTFK